MYHNTHKEVGDQLVGIGFLFQPCEFWGWNSGLQA